MDKLYLNWLKSFLRHPDRYPHLRSFVLLKDFSTFELHLLNNLLYKRTYKAGEMLYAEDYPLEAVFFILCGEVEVLPNKGGLGNRKLFANDFLGVIDMFHESTRSSSARANTDVETLVISKQDLLELISLQPKLGVKFLTNTCHYFSDFIFNLLEFAGFGTKSMLGSQEAEEHTVWQEK